MHLYVLSVVLKNLLLLLFCTIWQWCEELHLHEDLWSLGLNCNSVSCVQGWKGKSSQEKDGGSKPSVSWISGPKVSWPRTLSLGALPGALQLTQSGMMIWMCFFSEIIWYIFLWLILPSYGGHAGGCFWSPEEHWKVWWQSQNQVFLLCFLLDPRGGCFSFWGIHCSVFPQIVAVFCLYAFELRCLLVQGQSKMEWSLSSQAYCSLNESAQFFCCYNVSWVLARIMTWVILFHSTTEVFTHCIQDLTPQFVTLQRMAAAAKKFRHVLRIGRPVYQTASLILQQKDVSSWISCTLFRSV